MFEDIFPELVIDIIYSIMWDSNRRNVNKEYHQIFRKYETRLGDTIIFESNTINSAYNWRSPDQHGRIFKVLKQGVNIKLDIFLPKYYSLYTYTKRDLKQLWTEECNIKNE